MQNEQNAEIQPIVNNTPAPDVISDQPEQMTGSSQNPLDLKPKSHKKVWIILSIILVPIILFVLWVYFTALYPYRNSEQKLDTENRSIVIPGATMSSQHYSGGTCFDNCPQLTETYTFSPVPAQAEANIIATSLSNAGYKVTTSEAYIGVDGNKTKYQVTAQLLPYGVPESSVDNGKIISTVTLTTEYNPSL